MENAREEVRGKISLEIATVERAMQRTQLAIHKHRTSLKQDEFNRLAASMPSSLRTAYESGTWKNSKVYMWDVVLEVADDGHEKTRLANDGLSHISYKGPLPSERQLVEHSKPVSDALQMAQRIAPQVRKALVLRRERRKQHLRMLTREYMSKRQFWSSEMTRREKELSDEDRSARIERDRRLLIATRASSGMGSTTSYRDTAQMFDEIEQAGGTAGGLERWSRSITRIPVQDPTYLPPAGDGGGVLIADPLEEHYQARVVNPWTQTERYEFLDKYVQFGKNFRKIASFFEYKSVDDIVRFYYDNKLPLRLKLLGRDHPQKRRGIKKNVLIELSKLPVESRSIWDNFRHQRVADFDERTESGMEIESNSSGDTGRPNRISKTHHQLSPDSSWSVVEVSRLINGLCRYDVSFGKSSSELSWAWARISAVVESKTPVQCQRFYDENRDVRGLDHFKPPLTASVSLPTKRAEPSSDGVVDSSSTESLRKQARLVSSSQQAGQPLATVQHQNLTSSASR